MIEQRNIECLGGITKSSGEEMIGVTGPRVTARMIVSDQQCGVFKSAAEDVRNRNVDGCLASQEGQRLNQSKLVVAERNDHKLLISVNEY